MLVLLLALLIVDEKRSQTDTMPQQRKLDCPFCNHPRLINLSDHFSKCHNLNEQKEDIGQRKQNFQLYLDNQNILNHLFHNQTLHLDNVGTLFLIHPYYLSKRNYQSQYHPNLHQVKVKMS